MGRRARKRDAMMLAWVRYGRGGAVGLLSEASCCRLGSRLGDNIHLEPSPGAELERDGARAAVNMCAGVSRLCSPA